MNKNELAIIQDFKRINKMNFICFDNKYYAGTNLEKLLNKSGDCFNIPDYENIEIKTLRFRSKYNNIALFSSSPDGPYVFPIKRIARKYGYPDKEYKNKRIISGNIKFTNYQKIGLFYYFKLNLDKNKQRIYLSVYDWNKNFIGHEAFWDFDSIYEKLYRKLKNIAIFYYVKKRINDKNYFWFNELEIYSIKDIDFINLIEDGTITLSLKCGIVKSGKYKGKFIDRGPTFKINKNKLYKLYIKTFKSI